MGKVFLSGGGDKEQTEKIDKDFVKQINPNKPLLYIPIAMEGAIPYEDCFEWINGVLKPMGIQNITMWTDLKNKSLEELNQFSAIYIGGGNTFSLLNDLRNSKFDELLNEYIENEGIVYGG
ncbi:MAG TPA: Type 1 glutamine amidotransferase-like domain-containing protein, partial [Bacillus sp. (in: firmicutes)]|nr:Type 1 glutamine amidotransferase-like domain-containing protein [Bacillus sp. (in: firmicutes)]